MGRAIIDMCPEKGRRMIVVSDVHAHMGLLHTLLERIGFSQSDLLVIIGDIIECGHDSLAALRYAMDMEHSENVIVLAGNWEHFLYNWMMSDTRMDSLKSRSLQLMRESGASLLEQMCAEIGIKFDENADMPTIMPLIREKFAEELAFMARMPVILDTGDFFFVHGGVTTLDKDALSNTDPYRLMKFDDFESADVAFDRWVVVGHWPLPLYDTGRLRAAPRIDRKRHIISIDGGVGKNRDAQLNALILHAGDTENIEYIYEDGLEKVRALDAQQPSDSPSQITWMHRQVEVISRDADIAHIRQAELGLEMDIPASFLYISQQAGQCTSNVTDNRLGVALGDTLSVVARTPKGLYCKKDSETGWYFGRYTET